MDISDLGLFFVNTHVYNSNLKFAFYKLAIFELLRLKLGVFT